MCWLCLWVILDEYELRDAFAFVDAQCLVAFESDLSVVFHDGCNDEHAFSHHGAPRCEQCVIAFGRFDAQA